MMMQVAYVEFRLESATQNVREFYASRVGTHKFFTKEAVACAITYSEVLQRDKNEEYQPLDFSFNNTPAEPIDVKTAEVVYKAGDNPNMGLLRYGRQELILPGSTFRFVVWGIFPPLIEGQTFLIGKKRAAATIIKIVSDDVKFDTTGQGKVMPIQVSPLSRLPAYIPLVLTNRYYIIRVQLSEEIKRLKVGEYVVPILD